MIPTLNDFHEMLNAIEARSGCFMRVEKSASALDIFLLGNLFASGYAKIDSPEIVQISKFTCWLELRLGKNVRNIGWREALMEELHNDTLVFEMFFHLYREFRRFQKEGGESKGNPYAWSSNQVQITARYKINRNPTDDPVDPWIQLEINRSEIPKWCQIISLIYSQAATQVTVLEEETAIFVVGHENPLNSKWEVIDQIPVMSLHRLDLSVIIRKLLWLYHHNDSKVDMCPIILDGKSHRLLYALNQV